MSLKKRKLLTIISETILQPHLIKDLKAHGVKGYSMSESQGEGTKGLRMGDWALNTNITIQIICTTEVGTAVLEHIHNTYYGDYAIIAYLSDAEVHPESHL